MCHKRHYTTPIETNTTKKVEIPLAFFASMVYHGYWKVQITKVDDRMTFDGPIEAAVSDFLDISAGFEIRIGVGEGLIRGVVDVQIGKKETWGGITLDPDRYWRMRLFIGDNPDPVAASRVRLVEDGNSCSRISYDELQEFMCRELLVGIMSGGLACRVAGTTRRGVGE